MIKPKTLQIGDTIAIVSLSSGIGGDSAFIYRYFEGKKRIENIFGLKTVTMPNALKGSDYIEKHPEKRAKDLMDAFLDPSIKAIFCMIGGDDTIRLLPYIDYDIIRKNPKIFMGYSDTTINHFMMYKAGLVSFYGPSVLTEFAENVKMHEYTIKSIKNILFSPSNRMKILPSPQWTSDYLDWANSDNQKIQRTLHSDTRGFEVLQGKGIATGQLLGGCLGVFKMMIGTDIWLKPEEWNGKILFLETGEDYPSPNEVCYFLRNLVAQGIIHKLNGIVVGKPLDERYYEEYKGVYLKVVGEEAHRSELPILFNMNCGHTAPTCVLPFGVKVQIDCDRKEFSIVEYPLDKVEKNRSDRDRDKER